MAQQDQDVGRLFFQPKTEELPIRIGDETFLFTIKGFFSEEFEAIASQAATTFERDGHGLPQARLNVGRLNHLLLKEGVIKAPINWTDENISRLRGEVREPLLTAIYALTDEVGGLQKKSGPSSKERTETPES